MLSTFKTYQLALKLYRDCEGVKAPHFIKDQLQRATLSIVLNTAEGSAKPTPKERRRFYSIALASCRETQALLQVLRLDEPFKLSNEVGGCLYRLVHPCN